MHVTPVGASATNYSHAAVRVGRHKLIVGATSGGDCDPCPAGGACAPGALAFPACEGVRDATAMLFDLDADPSENVDRYGDPALAAVRAELEARLAAYVSRMRPALYNLCDAEGAADPAANGGLWAPGWCEPPYSQPFCGL